MAHTQVWNPEKYNQFKDQRAKPFQDLMGLIHGRNQTRALDLGCGTGELTRLLHDEFKIQSLLGIDSSPEMLAKAQAFSGNGLRFEFTDISSYLDETPYDLVLSNAALQWVPDHEALFPKLFKLVKTGGEIAIQMPCNFEHPSHRLAAKVAHHVAPAKFPTPIGARKILTLDRYAELLFKNGFKNQICRIQVYGHQMSSGREVLEWTQGTLLTAYQAALSAEEYKEFYQRYETELLKEIGEGPYFYAFQRMLLWGVRE